MNDYIHNMRKIIGHKPLMAVACGAIIENEKGEILLQKRSDNKCWSTPGGAMDLGETFIETAKREVFEETGLIVEDLTLWGIYSGNDCIMVYPNEDVCYYSLIVFYTKNYKGELIKENEESLELKFFAKDQIPSNINPTDIKWIEQWKNGIKPVIVD